MFACRKTNNLIWRRRMLERERVLRTGRLSMDHLRCIECGATYSVDEVIYQCRKCSGILEVVMDLEAVKERIGNGEWRSKSLGVWRYADFLPIKDRLKVVTLNEGGTGLHRCRRLGEKLGLKNLYVKFEGENPTGSFK